jgi:hypothetical protein
MSPSSHRRTGLAGADSVQGIRLPIEEHTVDALTRGRCAGVLGVSAIVLAASPAVSGPPQPTINVTCAAGGVTTVTWKHVRGVNQVSFQWYAAGDSSLIYSTTVNTKRSPASVSTPTTVSNGDQADGYLNEGTLGAAASNCT